MINAEKYREEGERKTAFWKWLTSFPTESLTPEYAVSEFARWLTLEFEDESFESIVEEMRKRMIDREHSPSLWPYIDRMEAAHQRVKRSINDQEETDADKCLDEVMIELKKAVPGYSYEHVKKSKSMITKYKNHKNKI